MPYVEGETLRSRLERERQLPVDETSRLVTLMAGALDYAHARGVIHRDLKPENILLQAGQPVIADFGIALAVAQAGGSRVTETGLSLGTPHYMSPEQAAGERNIDAKSDQYALAAVTYEMLSGEPPHTGPTAQAIIARHDDREAPEPAGDPFQRAGGGGSRRRAGVGQVTGRPVPVLRRLCPGAGGRHDLGFGYCRRHGCPTASRAMGRRRHRPGCAGWWSPGADTLSGWTGHDH